MFKIICYSFEYGSQAADYLINIDSGLSIFNVFSNNYWRTFETQYQPNSIDTYDVETNVNNPGVRNLDKDGVCIERASQN